MQGLPRKGTRVVIYGNHVWHGTVLGRFQGRAVVELDKPIRYGRKHISLISILHIHPDNMWPESKTSK